MTATLLPGVRWCAIKDGDARARALYHRHYSYRPYADGRAPKLFVSPGYKFVLLTPAGDALFVWHKAGVPRLDRQEGVSCAVFRNESPWRSDLIREACALAWGKWPGQRLFTYVNPAKLPPNKRAGFCFEAASWRRCGVSKGGLLILEVLP